METIKTDPAVARVAERMVKSIEKVLPKNSALYKRITAYGKKYEGKEEMNEEKMAELFAILSANPTQFKSLPKNVKSQIIDIIDRFFKKVFGASPFTTPDSRTDAKVFEFMETLSGKIRRGETVTEEDVSVLKEIEKETAPKKKAPSKKKAPAKTEAAQDTPRKGKYQLIADRFTEDQTSNTGKIAEEKVSLDEIKGARLPGGTTRNVYNIGDKVLKIAKNPKGLQQNQSLQYGDLNMLGSVVPNIHEIGLDYIVTENVPRNDKALNEFLKPLRKFTVQDWETKTSKLQDVLYEKGLEDFMNYDLLWNDFVSARNWGQRENGEFVLIDEGALNKNVTSTSEIPVWVKEEWELIKSKRRAERKAPAKTEAAQDTPRKGKEQKSVQEVLVQTNMNAYGFYPANMSAYDQQYVLNLLPQGFDLKKSRVDEYGRGGGWRLFDSNGRRVKKRITRKGKQQLMDKESELVSIVALGREKGAFTDGGIKEYLMRRLKNGKREFSAKEINAALKFNTDLFKSMPKSFGNIEGGFMKGIKLLTNLENYYTKLLKKNKT